MDTITLAGDDEVRRMSYAEIAEHRSISVVAARRLTQRHRWHRQVGNDGLVTVTVPTSFLAPQDGARRRQRRGDRRSATVTTSVTTTSRALDMLAEQLAHERARADRAEAELADRRQWGVLRRLRNK